MSVEIFIARFPASPAIKEDIKRLQKPGNSPIVTFCRSLADESARGLREILKRNSADEVTFEPKDLSSLNLPPQQRSRARLQCCGILFGLSIPAIERTVIERVFDAQLLSAEVNIAISGTLLRRMWVEGNQTVPLSVPDWQSMIGLIKSDKTFGSFFQNNGLKLMPRSLRIFLESSGLLPDIREIILPMYQERAKYLI